MKRTWMHKGRFLFLAAVIALGSTMLHGPAAAETGGMAGVFDKSFYNPETDKFTIVVNVVNRLSDREIITLKERTLEFTYTKEGKTQKYSKTYTGEVPLSPPLQPGKSRGWKYSFAKEWADYNIRDVKLVDIHYVSKKKLEQQQKGTDSGAYWKFVSWQFDKKYNHCIAAGQIINNSQGKKIVRCDGYKVHYVINGNAKYIENNKVFALDIPPMGIKDYPIAIPGGRADRVRITKVEMRLQSAPVSGGGSGGTTIIIK